LLQVFRIVALVMCMAVGWAGPGAAQAKTEGPIYNLLKELQDRPVEPPPPPRTSEQEHSVMLERCATWRLEFHKNITCRTVLERDGYLLTQFGQSDYNSYEILLYLMRKGENFAVCLGGFRHDTEFDHCTKLSEPPK
jgi:hypothetical protein